MTSTTAELSGSALRATISRQDQPDAEFVPRPSPVKGTRRARPGITVNGKFLGGSLTAGGVHRSALNFTSELILRSAGVADCRVVSPGVQDAEEVAAAGVVPEIRRGPLGGGQAWEMLALPAIARRDLLVNFCNLAPVLHPNSVVMIHDTQTLDHPGDYSRRQAAGYRAMWPIIGRRARAILTVSEHSRHCLADRGIGTLDKIFVVPNGTDHILRTQPTPSIIDRLSLQGRRFALTIGSTQSYKNLRTLFSAFRAPELADVPLVIVGRVTAEQFMARGWEPPPQAIFAGGVSDGELRALYEAARVFLFASETEGFGMPPVEAMQCGTAAVVARGGAMPEVCRDGAVIVPPLNADAWAAAVSAVIEDDGHTNELVARGTARAADLTWAVAGEILWSRIAPLL
ncbi:glycosyltransferase family 4 protein [Histidinibacterium aquaticum]|uniref:Glycosyltransferase family 4 protein n=1 Tax=Histidinibacterium aquaticum TaxID=2613962 RepID=A0A5J5GMA6_9RHOB|nr:glycosyltransferase family 1 protein [Histidinibacterium aquaticum]KAA9009421.1 glycosyltransferase family 4 protein [Histidinibacterium aquaticum]